MLGKLNKAARQAKGFTIVELLIVIVVIAILAAVSVVAYTGIQQRARDSQRKNDVAQLAKALELYYLDNGQYPRGMGSTAINPNWSSTADTSWSHVISELQKYMGDVPSDPISTPGVPAMGGGYNYDFFGWNTYCETATSSRQMYIIIYRLEGSPQTNTYQGDCPSNPVGPYSGSNFRVVRR